tara:strand:+ start:429 stop:602 length:174 start_codon:yes stop_codon:yes gene_type:complete
VQQDYKLQRALQAPRANSILDERREAIGSAYTLPIGQKKPVRARGSDRSDSSIIPLS